MDLQSGHPEGAGSELFRRTGVIFKTLGLNAALLLFGASAAILQPFVIMAGQDVA